MQQCVGATRPGQRTHQGALATLPGAGHQYDAGILQRIGDEAGHAPWKHLSKWGSTAANHVARAP